MEPCGEGEKRDVRRPMNAFLIFCKRHRSIVREKNPDLDNRSVTRILGDLWANLKEHEKVVYTDLAKQYKDAFMKANPDYKWHNPEKAASSQKVTMPKPTNVKVIRNDLEMMSEGSIIPGKLADPSNMGGLSLLLIAGQQSETSQTISTPDLPEPTEPVTEEPDHGTPVINKVKWNEESITKAVSREPGYSPTKTTAETMAPAKQEVNRLVHHSKIEENRTEVNDKQKPFHFETHIDSFAERKRSDGFCETSVKIENLVTDSVKGDLETSQSRIVTTKIDTKVNSETSSKVSLKTELHSKLSVPAWNTESLIKDRESPHKSLLALAEMCESKKVPMTTVVTEAPAKPLLYQAVAAPKISSKSLLAEAFMDTCDKGSYSDILKDTSACANWAKGDNQLKCVEDQFEHFDGKSEADEKENISKLMMKDVGDSPELTDDESPMITCGKLVVNHIIDRIFSSDIATAARKASVKNVEKTECGNNKPVTTDGVPVSTVKASVPVGEDSKCDLVTTGTDSLICDYDEPDGVKHNPDLEKDAVNKICNIIAVHSCDETGAPMETESCLVSELDPHTTKLPSPSSVGRDEDGDGEMDDSEDFQPVRKSRRRNRGQRYQELINEGIIQPSKERMAALKQDAPKEECSEEDFQSIDSYILPETAIRRFRKRTTSESAKDKMQHVDDAKRYKTGDFDLEAHIATLPACPVESMGRKRGFVRQRHHSETTHIKKDEQTQLPVFDIKKAVSLPPHVKIPSPEKSIEPVVGSRKRKARKHSITHLLPAPPALISNGNEIRASITGNGITVSDIKPTARDKSDSVSSSEHGDNSETKPSEMDVFSSTVQTSSMPAHREESAQEHVSSLAGGDGMLCSDKTGGSTGPSTNTVMSRIECKKVLSAYEINRHLEPSCTQPSMCNNAAETEEKYSKGDNERVDKNSAVLCSEKVGVDKDSQSSENGEKLVNNSDSNGSLGVRENKTVSEAQSVDSEEVKSFTGWSSKNCEADGVSADQKIKQLASGIPRDQSETLSYDRCRSEVNAVSCDMSSSQSGTLLQEVSQRTKFTHTDYRSGGGDLNQCSAIEKDKDLNFNTKVQC